MLYFSVSIRESVSYPWLSGWPKAKLLNIICSPVSHRKESFRDLYVSPKVENCFFTDLILHNRNIYFRLKQNCISNFVRICVPSETDGHAHPEVNNTITDRIVSAYFVCFVCTEMTQVRPPYLSKNYASQSPSW